MWNLKKQVTRSKLEDTSFDDLDMVRSRGGKLKQNERPGPVLHNGGQLNPTEAQDSETADELATSLRSKNGTKIQMIFSRGATNGSASSQMLKYLHDF